MKRLVLAAVAGAFLAGCATVERQGGGADLELAISFSKQQVSPHFWGEGADFGDFNNDGKLDVVSGPFWYEGPSFGKRHVIYAATNSFVRRKADGSMESVPGFEGALGEKNVYSDNFFAFAHDYNFDGWTDVVVFGFPGKEASVFENPAGKGGAWRCHVLFGNVENESPWFTELIGGMGPVIVCNSGGFFGYALQESADPSAAYVFHKISPQGKWGRFQHGLGVGDVNGDGRLDIVEGGGWWEQPEKLEGDPVWKKHPAAFGLGAQYHVGDVNGDGRADVVGSVAAHGYGLAWWEQQADGSFVQHKITGATPAENKYGVCFSQPHAADFTDVDGDGLKDIVTGKRFWAHGSKGDPEPNAAAVLYWFKCVRNGSEVEFVPHLIDDDSGVGTQVVAKDINGDGVADVVVGNKKGTFVHLSKRRWVAKPLVLGVPPSGGFQKPVKAEPAKAGTPNKETNKETGEGVLPLGKDGMPLNLGFEDGTLRDWSATGDAFRGQPVKGPINQQRKFGAGRVAEHQGEFWIGGYEVDVSDVARGTLVSAPFKVTHPFASMRVGGGAHPETRVELVRADTKAVFFTARGRTSEKMFPVVVDLVKHKGAEIFIRIVDERSDGWGHVNFDDFQFYESAPTFAAAAKGPGKPAVDLSKDQIKHAGLSPADAIQALTLPPGFTATMFAAEPDVKQPVAFALDDRARLWVVEAYSYPKRQPEGEGKDRILVLADTDGDGTFDKRTVFMEGLNLVSGIEVGFGGVWVGAAPYFMFIPIAEGDEPKPAGEPKILLDGWGYGDTHETMNTFAWGPDGWLYGCHGIFTQSKVGKPGATDEERTKMNAGIWRFHPVKHRFEVFAEGTSNPWGLDFNDLGHCFIEACVIPHLWHIVQGGRFHRQAGQHFNPHLYDDIKTIGDHVHWAGGGKPHAANGKSDSAGGGHAHAGLLCYLGSSWPDDYRGALFMNNIHGARINMDTLAAKDSGYVGSHGKDFALFNDAWSQIINLQSDQDGSVFMIDWYDQQQCHRGEPEAHDRSNGRIFKIAYKNQKTTQVDLATENDRSLVMNQLRHNEWHVRHARRLLQERAAAGTLAKDTPNFLRAMLHIAGEDIRFKLDGDLYRGPDSTPGRLRLLWTLHAVAGLTDAEALELLQDDDAHVRAWTIQLVCEDGKPSDALLREFVRLAKSDPSPIVRLYLASAAQRIEPARRWDIVAALHTHGEDAGDHNLPLMAWYALEPLVALDHNRALALALGSKLPRMDEFGARRAAALDTDDARNALASALNASPDEARQLAILKGMTAAMSGRRSAPEPKGWADADAKLAKSANDELRALTQALSLKFGNQRALAETRALLADGRARNAERLRALDALLGIRDALLAPVMIELLEVPALRGPAIRGLASYGDEKIPAALLSAYPKLSPAEKRDALLTLASRASFAAQLMGALEEGRIPKSDVAADVARQIGGLKNAALAARLEKFWGRTRETPEEKKKLIEKYTAMVEKKNPPADASRGRLVYMKTCFACHTLFGEGGKIGPDLTGSNRGDLGYVLHNIVDPSAEIPNDYRTATVTMKDGRVIAGIADSSAADSVTVQTGNEKTTLPRAEIQKLEVSEVSMMPEGILNPLTEQEVRDLVTYLRSAAQTPLP